MARRRNDTEKLAGGDRRTAEPGRSPQARTANRLKDEVYREMFLLESNRPGSEMALALALLRAVVQADSLGNRSDFREWLKSVCPIALRMIEASLGENPKCALHIP